MKKGLKSLSDYGKHSLRINHAREPLYSNGAVIAWWLQSTRAQNSVHIVLYIGCSGPVVGSLTDLY